jgi:tRNA 5-methylaminomethyl-2-thiouridine biosynthesis bifunctional protein
MSHDDSSLKRQNSLLNARPDKTLFEELNLEEARERAGIKLNNGGIFFEKGGFIETKALCQDLLSHSNINLILSSKIEKIKTDIDNHRIFVKEEVYEYKEVCLCTGHASEDLLDLPGLSPKRGQISYVDSSKDFENLKFPICASGYFSPKVKGSHVLGSSYSDIKNDIVLEDEHADNLKKLKAIHDFNVNIHDGNVGFRAVTKDRLPLIGSDKGIYVNTGHGSRGSTSSPLCAEIIADLIDNRPLPVDHEVAIALDVNRFN